MLYQLCLVVVTINHNANFFGLKLQYVKVFMYFQKILKMQILPARRFLL